MVHLRCDEPVQIQVLSQNQAGRSNEMARPTLIYDVGMDSGHSSKLQHQVKWAHFGRSLHVSQMTANWGRAAFQADEYILGIIVNFVRNKLPFSVTWLACSSGFFP